MKCVALLLIISCMPYLAFASELPSNQDLTLTDIFIPMSPKERAQVEKSVPYLKNLVSRLIFKIEVSEHIKEKFDGLEKLKAMQTQLESVDQDNVPLMTKSLQGQITILYWLVQCSHINECLKLYEEQ